MAHQFTRQELHELAWSKPMKRLAADLKLSDVGLAKVCHKADIPVPERGYWARKEAGKPVIKRTLPPRFPGAPDGVEFGNGYPGAWRDSLLTEPPPPPPAFDEDLASVADRVRKMVGKVVCSKNLTDAHKLIATLLKRDQEQHAKYSWCELRYESAAEKRRLRLLNTIFVATHRAGCQPSMSTSQYNPNPHQASVSVGGQNIIFTLGPVTKRGAAANRTPPLMCMTIHSRRRDTTAFRSWLIPMTFRWKTSFRI